MAAARRAMQMARRKLLFMQVWCVILAVWTKRVHVECAIILEFECRTRWEEGVKFIPVRAGKGLLRWGVIEEQGVRVGTLANDYAPEALGVPFVAV